MAPRLAAAATPPGGMRGPASRPGAPVPATAGVSEALPALLASVRAFAIPMPTRFRGITVREGALIERPAGWGEFSPFAEYGPRESARWLACAIEAATTGWPAPARTSVPVNVTVPAVGPGAGPRHRRRVRLPHGQGQGRRAGPARRRRTWSGSRRCGTRWARRAGSGWTPTAAGRGRGGPPAARAGPVRPGVRRAALRHPGRAGRTAPAHGRAAGRGRVDPAGRGPAGRSGPRARRTSSCSRPRRWAGWPPRWRSPRTAACRWWCPARSSPRSGWPPGWRWPRPCPSCPTPAAWAR